MPSSRAALVAILLRYDAMLRSLCKKEGSTSFVCKSVCLVAHMNSCNYAVPLNSKALRVGSRLPTGDSPESPMLRFVRPSISHNATKSQEFKNKSHTRSTMYTIALRISDSHIALLVHCVPVVDLRNVQKGGLIPGS